MKYLMWPICEISFHNNAFLEGLIKGHARDTLHLWKNLYRLILPTEVKDAASHIWLL